MKSNSDATKPWVVQKYGGTSVGKFADKIAEDIVRVYVDEYRVAVVCSARSTATKAEGTTNRLIRAAEEALTEGSKLYLDIVEAIRADHIKAAKELIASEAIIAELEKEIEYECERLGSFLSAAQIIEEISPKTKDIIIGSGEKLACRVMAALLRDRGVDAQYVGLDHVVPADYPVKDGLDQAFYDCVAKAIAAEVQKCGSKVPVVTGFFGVVPGSLLANIGRGYTDLCAALLAVGLGADELQIWKEVDGIFTADPRKVATARLLPTITPEEASELTFYGSEVIHPLTQHQVMHARIPIRIKNVENPKGDGTIIFPSNLQPRAQGGDATPPHPPKNVPESLYQKALGQPRMPTAITTKENIVVISVHSNRKSLSHGFYRELFGVLDKYRLAVDLIATSEVHVSLAVHSEARHHQLRLGEAIKELQRIGQVDVLKGMIILSVIGIQMKNMVGIAGRVFGTLAQNNINIEMISQGASEINISCVIAAQDQLKALNVLHHHLLSLAQ
ncbi:aspartate kinase [Saitoella complicata NRRL Y-17804]|nr:aspartate kinase [Saitoella complicata NRRL Y-17804]ODQ54846.1 aspartate kinase [Saitoella complicata NRRL Y-17804]